MNAKMEEHLKIQAEQSLPIWAALRNKGTAYQQSPDGVRTGDHMSAAMKLSEDVVGATGELEEAIVRMFAAVALGYGDLAVAIHARSIVHTLVRDAAALNAKAVKNNEAVTVVFKEH